MMTGFSFAVLLLSMHFKAWAETSFPIWKMSALLTGNSLDKLHDQPAKCIGFEAAISIAGSRSERAGMYHSRVRRSSFWPAVLALPKN